MNLTWELKDWNELDKNALYEMLALRIKVFVIEQNCPYQDVDGKDKKSLHLYAINEEGQCIACLRMVQPGVSYKEWSIGRVVTDPTTRGTGLGKELMRRAMEYFQQHANPTIRISAQSHLQKFYEDFGFERVSEEYMEDEIPHVEMVFSP